MAKERYYSKDYTVNRDTFVQLREYLDNNKHLIQRYYASSDFIFYRARTGLNGRVFLINGGLESEVLTRSISKEIHVAVDNIVKKNRIAVGAIK